MNLENIALGAEKVINFLPRELGGWGARIAGEKYAPLGKVAGTTAGYIADLALASAMPIVGGTVLLYSVAVGSPVLGAYRAMKKR